MTDVQFHELLLRLDRIICALERIVPSGPRSEAGTPGAAQPHAVAEHAGGVAPEESSEPVTLVPDVLNRFLASRGVRVRRVPPPNPADPVLDRLALYLGTHYQLLRDVLGSLKRTMQTGGRWQLRLAGRPQEVIGACCQFCHHLHHLAFLTEYRYHRAPRCLIEARTSPAPDVQNFLSGQWLERFIRQQVEAAAQCVGPVSLSILANAQIILPNNDDFELDLLVAVEKEIYWIESKTAAYQQYVRKYSQMARMFGLGADRSFLVLAEAPAAVCPELSRLTGMTVCRPEEFHATFIQFAPGLQDPQRAAQ